MKKPVKKTRTQIDNVVETGKDPIAHKQISNEKLRLTRGGLMLQACSCTQCGDTDCD
jgi:hypothetical protein